MEHARLKTSQTVGRGNWMQPVQLDRCTLHILDDSSVVRADRKGRVVASRTWRPTGLHI